MTTISAPFRSFIDLQKALKSKDVSCVSIVENYLLRIEDNKDLNAFIEVYSDEALKKAKIIDEKINSGTAGKLAGMVIGIKDNLCYKDHKVSASSKILNNFESLFSAAITEIFISNISAKYIEGIIILIFKSLSISLFILYFKNFQTILIFIGYILIYIAIVNHNYFIKIN